MNTISNYKNDVSNYIDICVSVIEDQLDCFFNACVKSSRAYSVMICDNFNNHSKEMFESIVISRDEILALVEKIYTKIQKILRESTEPLEMENNYKETFNIDYHKFLDDNVSQIQLTTKVIKICEKLINKIYSKAFDYINPNYFIDKAVRKVNIGDKLLSKNFKKSTNQQERIHKQLEGILINIKVDLKTSLLENINKIFEKHSSVVNL